MFIEVSHAGFLTVRSRDSVSSCPIPESPDPESLNPRAQNPRMLNLNPKPSKPSKDRRPGGSRRVGGC